MDAKYPIDQVPATTDYFMSLFQGYHRISCGVDEADPEFQLTQETTVAKWREECDLLGWRHLATDFGEAYAVDASLDEWYAVLEPPKKRTVGGVCDFLVKYATMPRIRPLEIAGVSCRTAGAFLTIRSLLTDAGADPEEIRPSTRLDEFAKRHLGVFAMTVLSLAPRAVPQITVKRPIYDASVAFLVGALIVAFLSCLFVEQAPVVCAAAWIAVAGLYLLTWVAAYQLPKEVRIGSLETFKDLSRLVAGETIR